MTPDPKGAAPCGQPRPALARFRVLAAGVFVAVLAGCAAMPATTPVIFTPEPDQHATSTPAEQPAPEPPAPATPPEQAKPLILVVSSDRPVYTDVANAISSRARGAVRRVNLEALSGPADALAQITTGPPGAVIAIGDAAAALTTRPLPDTVHVLAFQAGAGQRGVAPTPSPRSQFATWQAHFPEARRVGAVASRRFLAALEALATAAARADIRFEYRLVENDREAWFEFRRLTPLVDGFFLLPDQNVLNPDLIRDMVDHGHRNGLHLMAYNRFMRELGVDLVLTLEADAIASAALELVDHPDKPGMALSTFEVSTPVSRQVVSLDE